MTVHYGYIQARIQARYANLPQENLWLHLGALKGLTRFLEGARGTVLVEWISGISGNSNAEEIEQQLQQQLLNTITEITTWFDEPWRPALLWLATLIELPTLDYLIRSDKPLEEPKNGPLIRELIEQKTLKGNILQAWIELWRNQWPKLSSQESKGLESLLQLLQQHGRQFPELAVSESWQARSDLQARLRQLFRRQVLQPAMAFIYLALVALCLERLRAELLQRALFPELKAAS